MKDKKWIYFRHRVIRFLLTGAFSLYCKLKYHVDIVKFKEQEDRPYLILYNHQTAFDQFFVDISFSGPIYYLATEDIFSLGWLSSVLRYLVAPIPIKKQTMDLSAVKTCIRVAREGGSLAIAPEGNRTYSGRTEYINPSIAALAMKLGLPIALYRIEGGYGVHPRWSDVVRKGRMRSYVSEVIMPEEYKNWSKEELAQRICDGLYVDEANDHNAFYHPQRAEFLERAIYVCPDCGLSTFHSHEDTLTCGRCGKAVTYDVTTKLQGKGFDFPFDYVAQKDFINDLDVTACSEHPLYTEQVSLYEVIVYKKKCLIAQNVELTMYGDRLIIRGAGRDEFNMPYDNLSAVTVLGKNKLNVYVGETVYQIVGDARFNALKYVHIYNRYKNIQRGDMNGRFLGL